MNNRIKRFLLKSNICNQDNCKNTGILSVALVILLNIIVSGASVYATYTYLASQINYTKKDESIITVSDALNDLYEKTNNNYTYTNGANPIPSSTDDSKIICSSSSNENNQTGYNSFDKNDDTFWTSSLSETLPQYIGWDFGEDVLVYQFSIKHRKEVLDGIVGNFILQGYKNGQWEDIQSYTNTNFEKNGVGIYKINNPKKYSKYQFKILTATNYYSGSSSRNHVQINQIDFDYLK